MYLALIMAPRKKPARRRRSSGVKLLNIAEGFVQANIVTESLMDTSALEFVLGDTGIGNVVSGSGIAVKSAVANFGFRFARRAVSRPVRLINKQLRALNLGVTL
mgnify:CR=1 FL=1